MESRIMLRQGRTIHLTTYSNPSSDTTIFFIHGLGGRSQQWREQINLLKTQYSLVIPDLFGHGKSDKPLPQKTNPYSFSEFDNDLHTLFNRYSSKKNIIVGHSYGGALATSLALDYQNTIEKLILICPISCGPDNPVPFAYHLPSFMLEWLRPTFETQFLRLAFDESTDAAVIAEETKASRKNPMYMVKAMISGMQDIPLLDISMLTIPTLIILGEHDGIVSSTKSEKFYRTLPEHRFETIKHAAHMEMLEKPKHLNRLMMGFLTQ